jgi:predicted nucleic acid-binding Zn ribbon protein
LIASYRRIQHPKIGTLRLAQCGVILEKLLLKQDEMVECDQCGTTALNKIPSTSSFRLRGCGWAHDGYRNKMTPQNNPANKKNPEGLADDLADIAEHRAKL